MGKKKKKILRKINPEKSNKMIVAVAIGLVMLFALFLFLLIRGGEPGDKKAFMESALDYLKRTEGVIDVVVIPEENRVKLIYDALDRKDFRKIARFAGMKVSLKLKKIPMEIALYRENQSVPEYLVVLKNGEIIRESQ
jgi:hypothetical protein